MAESVTTQPNKTRISNSVEINELNDRNLIQAKQTDNQWVGEQNMKDEDDCCISILKCYCLKKCFTYCPNTGSVGFSSNEDNEFDNEDNDAVYSCIESGGYICDDDYDYSNRNCDNEFDNRDNDAVYSSHESGGYTCDNTFDTCAGDSGGGDFGGCDD